jgi:hypothetical protein
MNPQSLNKYSYCFNNPLKYNDPTGHWPNWSKIGHAIASAAKAVVNVVKENINVIQTALDVAGMIPVLGEVCDVASGIISVAKGDWGGAGLSLASAIPIVGNVAGGATGDSSTRYVAQPAANAYSSVNLAWVARGESHKRILRHIISNWYSIYCTNSQTSDSWEVLNWDALGTFLFTCRIQN